MRNARLHTPQTLLLLTPLHTRVHTKSKRRLIVDIDAPRDIREGNDIDVITRVLLCGLHSRGFDEAREALPVAVDAGVDPVADGDGGAGVGERGVDGGAWMGGYEGEEEGEEEG